MTPYALAQQNPAVYSTTLRCMVPVCIQTEPVRVQLLILRAISFMAYTLYRNFLEGDLSSLFIALCVVIKH